MKLATTFAVLSSVAIFGCADTDDAPVPTEDETGGAQPAPPADDNDDQASESSGEAPPDAEEGGSTGDEDERGESTDTGDEGSTDTGDEGSTGSGDNEAQVRGLISVLDLEVVNADTDWSGGVVEIDFHDRAGVEPVYGNADVPDGTCAVLGP